jgi:TonB-linked SusC/RagA family outer membrane protein
MNKNFTAVFCRDFACKIPQFVKVMKITIILWFVTILHVSAFSYAQKVNLNVKNAQLNRVLDEISRQSDYSFIYDAKLLKAARPVNLTVNDEPFRQVLEKCFENQPLTFVINENTVIIQKRVSAAAGLQSVPVSITGLITDEKGQPLPGVTVSLKGTALGAATDVNGKYSLRLPDDSGILQFKLLGYATQEMPVKGKTEISLQMKEVSSALDELIIVGYGTRKKSDVTGSVSSVSEKQLREIPAGNIGSALQGSAPGLSVLKGSGNSHPGAVPVIRIRGERSLGASNDPLIILDGVPFGGSLNDVNPDDITSAQVLKDASATAIYGSRGSNGVVLISTRRGKNGKPVISYSGYAGFNKVLGQYDVMDANQFLTFRKWARINGSASGTYTGLDDPKLLTGSTSIFTDPTELALYQSGLNTDWQKLLYKTPLVTNHLVGVSGGTENTQYDASIGYYNAGGIYPGQSLDRYSMKLSIDHTINKYIKIGLSTINSYTNNRGLNINPVSQFLQASPFSTPTRADGTLYTYLPGSNQNVWNPLSDFVPGQLVDNDKRFNNFNTAYVDVNLTHGFKYKLNTGLQFNPETQGRFYGSNTTKQLGTQNFGYNYNGTGYNYTIENILTYDKTIAKDHVFNFTGLYSIQKTQSEANSVSYRNVLADYIQYYNPAYASNVTSTGDFTKWSILSYMARLNYAYKDKYLVTATVRTDGSSRLAAGNKWHTFPSAALAWNAGNEEFLVNSKVISSLKLRASYGTTANTSISPYETIGVLTGNYYNYGSTNVQGTYPDPEKPGNPSLGWENTSSLNFAVDYGILNNRILGSVEWYKQTTDEILLSQSLPATSGYSKIRKNIGQTQNVGMEFNLSTVNFTGEGKSSFKWTTDINVMFNRARINKLSSGVMQDLANNWFVGSPNGVIYDYRRVGLWQNTPEDQALAIKYGIVTTPAAYSTGPGSIVGTVKVADVNNDGKITTADKTILGSRQAKFEGGFTNRFGYKNFDLSVVTYFRVGGMLSSGIHGSFANSFQAGYNNLDVDYWTPDNPVNYWPKPNSNLQFPAYNSTLTYFSASYLKIRSLTLGYTIPNHPLKIIGAKSARIYATASNPFTFFSPYIKEAKGLDPETNFNLDTNTPATWQMLFGVNVSF